MPVGAPSLTGTPTPATVGASYLWVPSTSGLTAPLTFALIAGAAPSGTVFSTATGGFPGTPTTPQTRSGISIRVTDSASPTPHVLTLSGLSIVVTAAFVLTNSPTLTSNISTAYSYVPATTGGRAAYSWMISNKPAWASFNTSTGALTGTTPGTPETDTGIVITGQDADGRTVTTGSFTITISSSAVSDIVQAEVMGVTSLDPDGGAPSIGINMSGALLRVRAIVLDQVTIPDPTKLTLTVQDAGYDASLNAVTQTRTLVPFSNAVLHRQASAGGNQAVVYIEQPSGTIKAVGSLTVGQYADFFITLPDFVHDTSTVTIAASTGWYSTAAAGSGPAVTNSSTIKAGPAAAGAAGGWNPKYGWMNWPLERVEASSYYVELWCNAHHYAQNGQAVAGVQLWATDGTHTGNVSTVTSTTLSTLQTREAIAEVFAATIDLTGINDTDGSTTNNTGVQFIDGYIYPWIGPRYQISVSGVAWPTDKPCRVLPFVKDTAGKYGGAIAYVQTGVVGSTPAVSRTAAGSLAAAQAKAYTTIALAEAAIEAFNNQATGRPASSINHLDMAGSQIRLLQATGGGDQNYELAVRTRHSGNCWASFINAPENTTGQAIYNQTTLVQICNLYRGGIPNFAGLKAVKTATFGFWSCNNIGGNTVGNFLMMGWCESTASLGSGMTTPWLRAVGMTYLSNMNFDQPVLGVNIMSTSQEGGGALRCAHMVGITYADSTNVTHGASVTPYFCVGVKGLLSPVDPDNTNQTSNDGFVLDNFAFNHLTPTVGLCQTFVYTRGFWMGQGLAEYTASQDFGISGGAAGSFDIWDGIAGYITNPPDVANIGTDLGRFNGPYNDSSGTRGRNAYVQELYTAGARRAVKSDVFSVVNDPSHLTGNVGNFYLSYGVGSRGRKIAISRPASFTVGIVAAKVFDPTTTDNLGQFTFTNDKAGIGQTGYGSYSLPAGANVLKSAVPAGYAIRKYDFFGNARKNDGTGAAGMGEGS